MKAVLSILIVLGFNFAFAAKDNQSGAVDQVNQAFSLGDSGKAKDPQLNPTKATKLACEQEASKLGAAQYGLSSDGSSARGGVSK